MGNDVDMLENPLVRRGVAMFMNIVALLGFYESRVTSPQLGALDVEALNGLFRRCCQ